VAGLRGVAVLGRGSPAVEEDGVLVTRRVYVAGPVSAGRSVLASFLHP
jgi:hypothetical protein